MYHGHTEPTEKQLGYAAKLARDLHVGSEAIDLLSWANGWSRSKASSKLSKQTISEAIDQAVQRLKK